jgi:hypothetical protein
MGHEPDFLEELVTERANANPKFARLVEAAAGRRRQAKVAAYQELAQDEERLECIKQASQAAADAGIL